MATRRQTQIAEVIAHLAADYLARESNRESLITVTRADISPDLKNAMILLTVLPESTEDTALDFVKRGRTDFRDYMKKHAKLKFIPNIDFEIDYGEKNRQRVDDLTRDG